MPVARNADGSSITGPSYEYINFDNAAGVRYELTYAAATLDKSKATLTVRQRLDDAEPDSFFATPVDVDFRVTYAPRMVVAPKGGSSNSIEIQVQAK